MGMDCKCSVYEPDLIMTFYYEDESSMKMNLPFDHAKKID
jgi:hypothetical protein